MAVLGIKGKCDTMLGLLTSEFGYQNRLTLLQQLIECGDVLLGRELVYGTFLLYVITYSMMSFSLENHRLYSNYNITFLHD